MKYLYNSDTDTFTKVVQPQPFYIDSWHYNLETSPEKFTNDFGIGYDFVVSTVSDKKKSVKFVERDSKGAIFWGCIDLDEEGKIRCANLPAYNADGTFDRDNETRIEPYIFFSSSKKERYRFSVSTNGNIIPHGCMVHPLGAKAFYLSDTGVTDETRAKYAKIYKKELKAFEKKVMVEFAKREKAFNDLKKKLGVQ